MLRQPTNARCTVTRFICHHCGHLTEVHEAVECVHEYELYCESVCARAGCQQCYDEHQADLYED